MASRECEIHKVSDDKTRAIFIDTQNKEEIMEYLTRSDQHIKKFKYIRELILRNIRMPDSYDKEDISDKCKDVTAMKLFKGGSNDRIYCKEIKSDKGCYVIVMAILHEKKKSQKNKAKEISKITSIADYEYTPQL